MTLGYWSAQRSTELVSPEWRPGWVAGSVEIEIVSGVQSTIPNEFVGAAVQAVCPGFRDRVDDSSRRPSILGGVIARNNREFLDGIYSQGSSYHVTRTTICVVV